MTEPTYELNIIGKCLKMTGNCLLMILQFAVFATVCSLSIIMLFIVISSPVAYIYYVTNHNWNVLNIDTDDSSLFSAYVKCGFEFMWSGIIVTIIICVAKIWNYYDLSGPFDMLMRAIFYRKINNASNDEQISLV